MWQTRVLRVGGDGDGLLHSPAVVPLVVAPEHLPIEVEPGLNRVARRADPDDGLSSVAVLLEAFELLPLQLDAAGEDQHHVAIVQRLQTGNLLLPLRLEHRRLGVEALLEELRECRQRLPRLVFPRARHHHHLQRHPATAGLHRGNGKADGESTHACARTPHFRTPVQGRGANRRRPPYPRAAHESMSRRVTGWEPQGVLPKPCPGDRARRRGQPRIARMTRIGKRQRQAVHTFTRNRLHPQTTRRRQMQNDDLTPAPRSIVWDHDLDFRLRPEAPSSCAIAFQRDTQWAAKNPAAASASDSEEKKQEKRCIPFSS